MRLRFAGLWCVVLLTVFFLLSCESNLKDVQRMNATSFNPAGITEDINLKYTDSGKIKAILISPLMNDFTNLQYGFNEFPKGVNVTFYDNKGGKSHVVADYAITYEETSIIDLQGNVKLSTDDGKVLQTEQLYYDQKNEWFYTEKYFKFTDGEGEYEGPGIDFSKDFSVFNMQQNSGRINNLQ
ncbi:LPS export ABC transporter periplasmic protein LptC [Flavobacterium rhizosphaerae]|uniref:LPS export ABC transporter periplasmic protein LptC n=1 Tax=Flavobacterium rhizosphaerae TaxID=3163298 RepID=A0ABW8YS25_9FLAO